MLGVAENAGRVMRAAELFLADEVGWIGSESVAHAAGSALDSRRMRNAHSRSATLALVAGHPRLIDLVEADFGRPCEIAESAFWPSFGSQEQVLPNAAGVAAIVCLSWRGKLTMSGVIEECAPGKVILVDRRWIANVRATELTGPILAVGYQECHSRSQPPRDDCLWPTAWCVAG